MFCIIQCKLQSKFTVYILLATFCITILHPNLLVTHKLIKLYSCTSNGVLEQPANETLVHNVVGIRLLRHLNANTQRKLFAGVNISPLIGEYEIV